ncbi:hypothetical protein NLI96_g8456 [Meripilus lineatus]|uniref:Uncharacterized protein n=1 Tax=Meripilus lineatus TaxID=2056292 RepID=A0AAD5UXB9_9APHY|nr:hypothetical protein NLI96_g8456 [Physisporinus lineatus]
MPPASRKKVRTRQNLEADLATLKEAFARMEQEKAHAEDELRTAKQQITALQTAAPSAHAGGLHTSEGGIIERPEGKYSVEKASGLNHAEYLALRRDVQGLIIQTHLDWRKDFRRLDHKKLGLIYKGLTPFKAYARYPHLKRFRDNWLLDDITRSSIQNKRKYYNISLRAARRDDDTHGNGGSGEDEDEEGRDGADDAGEGSSGSAVDGE